MKICTICKESLDESRFGKDSSLKCGLASQCKACRKIKKQEWVDKNKEKVKAYSKQYRQDNLEKIKRENPERCKQHYYKNTEKL